MCRADHIVRYHIKQPYSDARERDLCSTNSEETLKPSCSVGQNRKLSERSTLPPWGSPREGEKLFWGMEIYKPAPRSVERGERRHFITFRADLLQDESTNQRRRGNSENRLVSARSASAFKVVSSHSVPEPQKSQKYVE